MLTPEDVEALSEGMFFSKRSPRYKTTSLSRNSQEVITTAQFAFIIDKAGLLSETFCMGFFSQAPGRLLSSLACIAVLAVPGCT